MEEENTAKEGAGVTLEGVDRAAGQPEDSASAEQSQSGALQSELEALRRENAELKDQWQRERAEFANFRKRTLQEKTRGRQEAVANFAHDLIGVLDNLELALQAKSENAEVRNFVNGVEMIRVSFEDVLRKQRVHLVRPQGAAFDPLTMEAIATEERSDLESDTVLEVYQSGCVFEFEGGEIQTIRPARVKVGKAVAASASSAEKPAGENG